jgi:hypothetical protein
MKKLQRLDETYLSFAPSDRCWLNGDYIWKVLSEYPGTLEEPILLTIEEEGGHITGPLCRSCLSQRGSEGLRYPLLIRVKLVIETPDPYPEAYMRHSNLLVLDFERRMAMRFEPIDEHVYTEEVNRLLSRYVQKIAPSLQYGVFDVHPQPEEDEDCPSKGMCVAYVVKAGLDIAMGRDVQDISLEDIKRFSKAVEQLY